MAPVTELTELREWKRQAMEILSKWEEVYQALGNPGVVGDSRAKVAKVEVEKMKSEIERLRSYENN
jgi:hypothetical protein